ncbi:MAG: hypothetical protein QUV10_10535 [Paracoccaceae bacterium]|jgi:hypothetical protein|uniref:hypothetical protein n=1 Tax=unclassified Seohaeicola TaxID=2641111 RepID=UPI00237B160A|nr:MULTISPECIES: hypothetical protein [unclassified Seohaeicola]MDD9707155.1 hypothetical protein [Seohaeicola sp. 4SK31]MDD9735396.1 hypothetical protein [Seohaeicola sp. SP36]MDM7970046.1 hypothetical protein [Paracoccaceae bacterium]
MPHESQSEIFIRLLGDAVQADRLVRTSNKASQLKDKVKRTRRLFQPDIDDAMYAIGPLDCVQLMAAGAINPQNG